MRKGECLYQAIVWPQKGSVSGERLTILANDLEDAERQLKQKYGEDIAFSLFNEDEASKIR